MVDNNANKKRIVKNTFMLYFRQILIMLVSLYSVRVVLNILGATDYGVYNVVAGIITLFSFLNTSMASASQRFFSFKIGKNEINDLHVVFNITLEIYCVLILIIVVIAETFGFWFVNNKLNIPTERLFATNVVYQTSVISFIFSFLSSPFMALIFSYEDMSIYAFISVVETLLKFSVIFLLQVFNIDKLILYGLLQAVVVIVIALSYCFYSLSKYKDIKIKFCWRKKDFSEIISYSGWCLFGTIASIAKNQITNILLNVFYGPIVNAARSIAFNINNAVISFASNFNMAVRPQIIKSYSIGNKEESFQLVFNSTKLSFYLLWIFLNPLFFEMNYVLTLWLKIVPEYTVIFTRLILIELLFDAFCFPLQSLSQANGKMKLYQSVVGGVLLLNLPSSLIALKLGANAYVVQVISIIIGFVAFVLRIVINKVLTGLSIRKFVVKSIVPCCLVLILSLIIPLIIFVNLTESFIRLIIIVFSSLLTTSGLFWGFGLKKTEKQILLSIIKTKMRRTK